MSYILRYEITNPKNGFKKLIDCELFCIGDLVKILAFYESVGFKVNIKERRENEKE